MALSRVRQFIREQPLFGILLFTIFFVPLAFIPFGLENYEVIKFPLFIICMGWFTYRFFSTRGRLVTLDVPLLVLFAALILITSISAFTSEDIRNAVIGFYPRFNNSLLLTLLWVGFCLGFVLVATKDTYFVAIKTVLAAGAGIALFGIAQSFGVGYYGGLRELLGGIPDRVPSFLGNPNFSSMFVAILVPWVLWLWATAKVFKIQILYFLILLTFVWALVIFASRGALLGFAIGSATTIAYIFYRRLILRGVIISAALIFCVGITAGFFFLYRSQTVVTTGSSAPKATVAERYIIWNEAYKMVSLRPWFGVGPGNIQIFYQRLQDSSMSSDDLFVDDVHNILLNILVSIGYTGLIIFILLLSYAGFRIFRAFKAASPIPVLSGIALCIFLIAGSFNPVTVSLWLLFGMCLAGVFIEPSTRHTIHLRLAAVVPVKIISVFIILVGFGMITGEQLLGQALGFYWRGDYPRAYHLAQYARVVYPMQQLAHFSEVMAWAHASDPSNFPSLSKKVASARNMHPTTARSTLIAGNIYWYLFTKSGNPIWKELAVQHLQEELIQSPYHPETYTHAAYYYLKIGNISEAEQLVKQGLVMKDDYGPAWLILAKLYQVQNKRDQFLYAINKAYRLAPSQENLKALREAARTTTEIRSLPLEVGADEGFLTD